VDRVSFFDDRGQFFRLVRRGAVLEFITLGFYRFWLITDIRRHLWSRTAIGGDAAEYIGTGKELLIGFLFALAILAPISFIYFLAGVELEHFKAFGSAPLLIAFYVFGQFAIFRARRYRLTRTVWRSVRFWMTGSGFGYAIRALLWGIPMLFTAGLLLPWRTAALERYKMRHSYYGDLQGDFQGRGWDLFKGAWFLWAVGIGIGIAALLSLTLLTGSNLALGLLPLILLFFAPSIYANYKAIEWRWWLSGIRFGEVRLTSSLERGALSGLYWKVIGWNILVGFALGILFSIGSAVLVAVTGISAVNMPRHGMASAWLLVFYAAGYLAFLLAMNVVLRLYLQHDLWQRVSASIQIEGLDTAANVAQVGLPASAIGEGLADGLDVAGF
jgi:uncharacterized membrane protein YjgN (DUF898 family)